MAYEGLRTRLSRGDNALAFDLDPAFLGARERADVLVKVTYLDAGTGIGGFGMRAVDTSGGPAARFWPLADGYLPDRSFSRIATGCPAAPTSG